MPPIHFYHHGFATACGLSLFEAALLRKGFIASTRVKANATCPRCLKALVGRDLRHRRISRRVAVRTLHEGYTFIERPQWLSVTFVEMSS